MKIVNRTALEDDFTTVIVKWLMKGMTRGIRKVVFAYSKRIYSGRVAYNDRIFIGIGKNGKLKYPIRMNGWRHKQFNFPVYEVDDEYELAVSILAHEVGHLKNHVHRTKNTEQRAEWFAFKKLQEMRQMMEE